MTVHHPPASVSSEHDTNVYSISDANLAQRYQFIREIGAGNWGCVWLCSPKTDEHRAQAHGDEPPRRVAVKLVFREKKPNTAQRVRSLWNEMKIVRALKQEPHPSIIPFHSFIITPSFAIITMEYLPYLIPVEVPEIKAREWFHSLLSAVHFLHTRGVVHNDIKPANILLSTRKVPMFVDFGFAEKYEVGSKRAFMSNLAYGTPEYLSPERARGTVHDTRKSDMWSLGITFFEILIGRTPFEYIEGEKLSTPADLERYWSRTAKGKWVGTWSMSKAAERLLRRMICPNVDTRCTAAEAILDLYWMEDIDTISLSPKNSLMTMSSPAPGMTADRVRKMGVKPMAPKEIMRPLVAKRSNLSEASDKTKSVTRPPRRVYPHALPTIEGSPISARTTGGRENIPPSPYRSPRVAVARARPSIKRKPVPAFDENMSPFRTKIKDVAAQTPTKVADVHKRRTGMLTDATSRVHNIGTPKRPATSPVGKTEKDRDKVPEKGRQFGSGSYDRVKAFERLKQLERNRFLEEEEDEGAVSDEPPRERVPQEKEKEQDQGCVQEVVVPPKPSSQCMTSASLGAISTVTRVDYNNTPARNFARRDTTPSSFTLMTDFKSTLVDRRVLEEPPEHDSKATLINSLPVSRHQASPSLFKHGIKASIDKTFGLYKLSIGRMNTRKPVKRASEDLDASVSYRASWEDYSFITDPKTSIPISRHPLHPDQVVADNKADRLSQWIRSVEQVVKEAKENFASSSITAPAPLPAPPASRAGVARAPRTQRKILPADQIFQEPESISTSPAEPSGRQTPPPPNRGHGTTAELPLPLKEDPSSPRSRRRATISSGPSPAAKFETASIDGTPTRRKEKSKSAGNLSSLVRPISPLSQLQKALEKEEESKRNLSELLDRSIFIARPSGSTPPGDNDLVCPGSPRPQAQIRLSSSFNPAKSPAISTVLRESNSSPILYSRPQSKQENPPDLVPLVKTGIKSRRVSKSQISAPTPVQAPPTLQVPPSTVKKTSRLFGSRQGRISHHQSYSDDLTMSHPLGAKSGTENFGLVSSLSLSQSASFTKDASKSVSAVRKAFKAIVSGRSAARRRQQQQQQHLQPQQLKVPV